LEDDIIISFFFHNFKGYEQVFSRLVEFYGQRGDRASCDALINHAKPLALEFLQEMA
jgi:hypothetical protein